MIKDWRETFTLSGRDLKKGSENSITAMDIYNKAKTNPQKYMLDDGIRPNMFRVRDALVEEHKTNVSRNDQSIQTLIRMYEDMSGLIANDAKFWEDPGFKEAVRKGHSIQLRRYIDDQKWVWIVVRDTEDDWVFKRRVSELDRQEAIRRSELRGAGASYW